MCRPAPSASRQDRHRPALWVARLTHLGSAGLLAALGLATSQLSWLYAIGASAAILLLLVEHALVRKDDSRESASPSSP